MVVQLGAEHGAQHDPSQARIFGEKISIMTIPSRSLAQADASRRNGGLSKGPATPEGRAIRSMNSVSHALTAFGFLTAEETPEMYQSCTDAWFASLHPTSPGLVHLAHRVVDVAFREARLRRLERHLVDAEVEERLAKSDTSTRLTAVQDALQGLRGLAALAESMTDTVSPDAAARLLPPMRRVCELVDGAEAPAAVTVPLARAVEAFSFDVILEVTVDTFTALAAACRAAETCLAERAADLEQELTVERESLELTVLLSDGKMIRMIDRHRTRLAREFDQVLAAYDRTRKLVGEIESSGSLGALPKVELKVIGRAAR